MKRYRLKKDINTPSYYCRAGAIAEYSLNCRVWQLEVMSQFHEGRKYNIPFDEKEIQSTYYWEEIKEEEPIRVVEQFDRCEQPYSATPKVTYTISFNKVLPEDKFRDIKRIINFYVSDKITIGENSWSDNDMIEFSKFIHSREHNSILEEKYKNLLNLIIKR